MMTLQQVQLCLPAARLVGDGALRFERVHTDTRSLQAGDLFVALKGSVLTRMIFWRKPKNTARSRPWPSMAWVRSFPDCWWPTPGWRWASLPLPGAPGSACR